jgi:fucose permease
MAFISLGLPDGLLGVAWPSLSRSYGMELHKLGILIIISTAGYLLTSINASKILRHLKLGPLLAASCLLTSLSILGFAFSGRQEFLFLFSFTLGAGGGAIDTSINTFAASRFSPSLITLLHAFYGIGATLGPMLLSFCFRRNLPWSAGYLTVGITQLALFVLFLLSSNLWNLRNDKSPDSPPSRTATLRQKGLWIGVIVFFLYTGTQESNSVWGNGLSPS